jgi:hypothetical protein
MSHPKDVGDRTTLAVMLALQANGLAVSVPFGENTRYDLIIDDGTELHRVQCKTGRLREGAIRFKACSSYAHHRNRPEVSRDYLRDIDYFAVYCPDTGGVYLVPIGRLPVRSKGALRVEEARNHQQRRIRRAAEYEIGNVALALTAEPGATAGAR